ncbi:MAG: 50S ribosomal protein L24 [Clostridia bacterium]|nr:50S ribosomal protein L24 [Clostridia bacterium]
MLTKTKLRKGDTVIVNTGSEKGKKGTILDIDKKSGKVTVKDINVRTKHVKARKQGQESGIIKVESPINLSKVNFYCDKCEKGVRLGVKVNEDGTKSRFCKCCNEMK